MSPPPRVRRPPRQAGGDDEATAARPWGAAEGVVTWDRGTTLVCGTDQPPTHPASVARPLRPPCAACTATGARLRARRRRWAVTQHLGAASSGCGRRPLPSAAPSPPPARSSGTAAPAPPAPADCRAGGAALRRRAPAAAAQPVNARRPQRSRRPTPLRQARRCAPPGCPTFFLFSRARPSSAAFGGCGDMEPEAAAEAAPPPPPPARAALSRPRARARPRPGTHPGCPPRLAGGALRACCWATAALAPRTQPRTQPQPPSRRPGGRRCWCSRARAPTRPGWRVCVLGGAAGWGGGCSRAVRAGLLADSPPSLSRSRSRSRPSLPPSSAPRRTPPQARTCGDPVGAPAPDSLWAAVEAECVVPPLFFIFSLFFLGWVPPNADGEGGVAPPHPRPRPPPPSSSRRFAAAGRGGPWPGGAQAAAEADAAAQLRLPSPPASGWADDDIVCAQAPREDGDEARAALEGAPSFFWVYLTVAVVWWLCGCMCGAPHTLFPLLLSSPRPARRAASTRRPGWGGC